MKVAPLDYRLRYFLHVLIVALGFTAPWNYWLGRHGQPLDPRGTDVWGDLTMQLGVQNVALMSNGLLVLAIVFAFAGAWLRTWGSAYLGSAVVKDRGMHVADVPAGIVEAGPFRYVRNPLYLGTFLHALALCLLMPRSGAIFTIVAIGLLQIRLIFVEEPFLEAKLGTPYLAYKRLVPRIVPSARPRIAASGMMPRWPQAFLGEIYMWGVALCFTIFGWRYNATLLTRCVLIALGVSIVMRALVGERARK